MVIFVNFHKVLEILKKRGYNGDDKVTDRGEIIIMSNENKKDNIYRPKSAPIVIAALLMALLVCLIIVVTTVLTRGDDEGPTTTVGGNVTPQVTTKVPQITTVTPQTTTTGNTPQTGAPQTTTTPSIPTPPTSGEITTTTRHYTYVDPQTKTNVDLSEDAVGSGSLILVDELHEYRKPIDQLITRTEMSALSESQLYDRYGFVRVPKSNAYNLKSNNLFLNSDATIEFINMLTAYAHESGNCDVQLRNAYYFDQSEQVCYNSTGYFIDLQVYRDEKTYPLNYEPHRSEYYDWFIENCCRFGFIHVGEGQNAAGQDIYSSFRYVGIPHATYMDEHSMDFEDYIDMVKSHTVESVITYTDRDGVAWQVYYVPAIEGGTSIAVQGSPDCYRISGNNTDGYIITINTAFFTANN